MEVRASSPVHLDRFFRPCVIQSVAACQKIGCATISVAILACLLISPAWPRSRTSPKHASTSVDTDYISALMTANRFLQAWQNHDQETGLLLLSDAAKQKTSADDLEHFFSSRQAAYEITRGQKVRGNRYRFSVVLFEAPEGSHPRHGYSELVVRRTEANDWIVDTLPRL